MKKFSLLLLSIFILRLVSAQETFPVNGVVDSRSDLYAFTNATIVKDPSTTLHNATLVIQKGNIISVGNNGSIPAGAILIDCKGKYIYPSFIELVSGYGISPEKSKQGDRGYQNISNKDGAFGWNEALRSETNAASLFTKNAKDAESLRSKGFGIVLSHQEDGIARGTGVLVTTGDEIDNFLVLKEKAASFFSFNKGTSTQSYPTSLMGSIALLRQAYLDGQWYRKNQPAEGTNFTLQAWNDNLNLPQIFISNDKWNDLRALKIAKEYGVNYIVKGGGNEYQRMQEMKDANASFILPVDFPAALDLEDVTVARTVSVSVLKHWEMAPLQPGMFQNAGINFALTSEGVDKAADFKKNLLKAIDNGLTPEKALEALTQTPARLIGVYDKVGSLDQGKLANFIISSGPLFEKETVVFQNWVNGKKYLLEENGWKDYRGKYQMTVKENGLSKNYNLEISGKLSDPKALLLLGTDSVRPKFSIAENSNWVKINWSDKKDTGKSYILNGIISGNTWTGTGYNSKGDPLQWNVQFVSAAEDKTDSSKAGKKETVDAKVVYPFNGYGFTEAPKQEDLLIRNTTVWTNETAGILKETDVLIQKGKITAIGKNLKAGNATVIDGAGKHLTAGIIDEHSHIAVEGGVNECSQSVTAEVRIADVIDPEDINIYRQLAGGVTSSHILHGSCNTIGGQTQLIKLRWGKNAEEMKFAGADGFIKFALGENVKRSYSSFNNRFPDTRMGVEQVLVDAFTRAKDYADFPAGKRKDLELETLLDILNDKRFITCHSYVQSEINMLLHVADSMGFKVNTFTHILEGYKVADKMKAHGAAAATFSDWWAYKSEVEDAIPYNAAIMQKEGVLVAINSDDAEMARHLNKEAAKTIKYGNLSEEEAWKMCTLNPAMMLHVSNRVGSIKTGKDADLVLWNENPLSVYAKPEKTIVDGIVYFDLQKDVELRKQLGAEKSRLIKKMAEAKSSGEKTSPAVATFDYLNECEEDHVKTRSVWDFEIGNRN